MKKLLFCFSLFALFLASCSKEEEIITPPAPNKYTLTITAEAGGSVSSPGGTYNEGAKITITATPDGQYLFEKWSDGSTVNPREITVTSNLTLSATFVKKTYPLSVTVEGEGTVQEEVIIQGSTSQSEHKAGTTVRLTATPNEGWIFSGWSGDIESEELEIEVPIEKGTSVSALFKRDSFELNITIEGEGTVKEEVIVQPGQYDYETVVRLTAIPEDGYEFSGWSGDVTSEESSIDLNVKLNVNLTARFSFIGYTVTRHSVLIPSSDFPSAAHLYATVAEISGGFIINRNGNLFFIRPGTAGDWSVGGIEEVDPSPAIILKKEQGAWNLKKIDKDIYSWGIRAYSQDENIITLADGNEIGPNTKINHWKGDVWQGEIDDLGEIIWNRVTTDENRSFHHGLATGDLNGDGLIDISTGPQVYDPITGDPLGQSIWTNNGNGTFEWKYDLLPKDAPRPFGLAFADLNGDFKDEIILGGNSAGFGSANYIHIYKLNDEGTSYELYLKLADNSLWDYGMFTTKIMTYDFNNDGNLDIIQYQADQSGNGFDIWLGDSSGGFSPHFSKLFEAGDLSSSEFEVFDANNDGYLDVLLRPNGYNPLFRVNPTNWKIDSTNGVMLNNVIWLNDGAGKFTNYDLVDLVLDNDIDGKPFHPKYLVPFLENDELHFLAATKDPSLTDDNFEVIYYDIRVFFE